MVFEKERDLALSNDLSPNNDFSSNIKQVINLLKLPMAHRWVCYEWFYSDIDKAIFDTENEFKTKVRIYFPELKTFQLKKSQWRGIRRAIEKPRRHSPAFFKDAIKDLNDKRARVRLLQRKKIPMNGVLQSLLPMQPDLRTHLDIPTDDLPNEIPLSTVVGTPVIVRMRKPFDGLYEGIINAVDVSRNSFRVLLESKGAHIVNDCDVTSKHPPKMISMTGMRRGRSENKLYCRKQGGVKTVSNELLIQMARLNTLIKMKEGIVSSFRVLNYESELIKVAGNDLSHNVVIRHSVFKRRLEYVNSYINLIISKMNTEGSSACGVVDRMMSVLNMVVGRDRGGDGGRLRNELDLLRDSLDPRNYSLFSRCVEQHFLSLF